MDTIVINSMSSQEVDDLRRRQQENAIRSQANNSVYGAINRVSTYESTITGVIQEISSEGIVGISDNATISYHPEVKPIVPTYKMFEDIVNRSKEDSINLFLSLQQRCDELGPLYIKDFDESELFVFKGFEEFLVDFVLDRNYAYELHGRIITYSKTISDNCEYQRNRSIGDLYRIVSAYYPGTSILDVAKTLVTGPKHLQMLYCPHISKIVFVNRYEKSYGGTFEVELNKWKNGDHKRSDSLAPFYFIYKVKDGIQTTDYANLLD
jgi:hypothetical protein